MAILNVKFVCVPKHHIIACYRERV